MPSSCELLTFAALSLLAAASGCGPKIAPVRGSVVVDGKPLENGLIFFASVDNSGQATRAAIKNGRYELETSPGKKIVQISAPVVVDRRKEADLPDAKMIEITAEKLPARYHTASELRFEVTGGENVADWNLTTK